MPALANQVVQEGEQCEQVARYTSKRKWPISHGTCWVLGRGSVNALVANSISSRLLRLSNISEDFISFWCKGTIPPVERDSNSFSGANTASHHSESILFGAILYHFAQYLHYSNMCLMFTSAQRILKLQSKNSLEKLIFRTFFTMNAQYFLYLKNNGC